MSELLLETVNLEKRFGAVQASKNLSLRIASGEVHALIGPNGAGKTTVIKQLAGEIRPDSGAIRFDGREITHLPADVRARLGIARSFQITSVFQPLTVEENVSLAVQAHKGHSFRFWRPAAQEPQLVLPARWALERVGLEGRSRVPAAHLSHGERRQLEVGMALAGNPKLLLLDEPMAGMGPGGTVKMTELIMGLKRSLTIVLVEHDMKAVFQLADRITVLVYGEPIATGTPEQIRINPDVRRAYLGDEQA
ncbi:MAG TPA: ABC transporter ATP-binding protein [Gammaproteobacteria bacterium]|nr:ABC transporter ATP-binding protein [Gammaproteobacteria bacterium]